MRLMILRHTSAADPHGYAQDADRPLTERGQDEAIAVALAMKSIGLQPDLILSSPYLRARSTARIIAETLALEPAQDCAELLPGADLQGLMNALSSRRVENALLVGHAPDLAYLVSLLAFGAPNISVEFSRGMLVILNAERPLRRQRALIQMILPLRLSHLLARNA